MWYFQTCGILFGLFRRFLAWFCRIHRFFFYCVTVFRIPLAALNLIFCACVFFCYNTGFNSVILCPVAVLERFTKQYSHDNLLSAWTHQQKQLVRHLYLRMLKSYGAATAPSHCTIYYYNCYNYHIIININTIWKGYFSVNPILSFCSFES